MRFLMENSWHRVRSVARKKIDAQIVLSFALAAVLPSPLFADPPRVAASLASPSTAATSETRYQSWDWGTLRNWVRQLRGLRDAQGRPQITQEQCPALYSVDINTTQNGFAAMVFDPRFASQNRACFTLIGQSMGTSSGGVMASKRDLFATMPPSVALFVTEKCRNSAEASCLVGAIQEAQRIQEGYASGDLWLSQENCRRLRARMDFVASSAVEVTQNASGVQGSAQISARECIPSGPPFPRSWDPGASATAAMSWAQGNQLLGFIDNACLTAHGQVSAGGRAAVGLLNPSASPQEAARYQTLYSAASRQGICSSGRQANALNYACAVNLPEPIRAQTGLRCGPNNAELAGDLRPATPSRGFEVDASAGWYHPAIGAQLRTTDASIANTDQVNDFFRAVCSNDSRDQVGGHCMPHRVAAGLETVQQLVQSQYQTQAPRVAREAARFYVDRLRDNMRVMACRGDVSPELIRTADEDLSRCGARSLALFSGSGSTQQDISRACGDTRGGADSVEAQRRRGREVYLAGAQYLVLKKAKEAIEADLGQMSSEPGQVTRPRDARIARNSGTLNCGTLHVINDNEQRVTVNHLHSVNFTQASTPVSGGYRMNYTPQPTCLHQSRGSLQTVSIDAGDFEAQYRNAMQPRWQDNISRGQCTDGEEIAVLTGREAIGLCQALRQDLGSIDRRMDALRRSVPEITNTAVLNRIDEAHEDVHRRTNSLENFPEWFATHDHSPEGNSQAFTLAMNEVRAMCFNPTCANPRENGFLQWLEDRGQRNSGNVRGDLRCVNASDRAAPLITSQAEGDEARTRQLLGNCALADMGQTGAAAAQRLESIGNNMNREQAMNALRSTLAHSDNPYSAVLSGTGLALRTLTSNCGGVVGLIPTSVMQEYTASHPESDWVLCRLREGVTNMTSLADGAIFGAITGLTMGLGAAAEATATGGRAALVATDVLEGAAAAAQVERALAVGNFLGRANQVAGAYFTAQMGGDTLHTLAGLAGAAFHRNELTDDGHIAAEVAVGNMTHQEATAAVNNVDDHVSNLVSSFAQLVAMHYSTQAFNIQGHGSSGARDPMRAHIERMSESEVTMEVNRLRSLRDHSRGIAAATDSQLQALNRSMNGAASGQMTEPQLRAMRENARQMGEALNTHLRAVETTQGGARRQALIAGETAMLPHLDRMRPTLEVRRVEREAQIERASRHDPEFMRRVRELRYGAVELGEDPALTRRLELEAAADIVELVERRHANETPEQRRVRTAEILNGLCASCPEQCARRAAIPEIDADHVRVACRDTGIPGVNQTYSSSN